MSNVIVRAEKEVLLATNYWQDSVASRFITNAIRELDRRAGERGTRVVVKVIYDRGSPKQLFEPHYYVPEKEYTSSNVNLPRPDEIPNIDLQAINFHTPLMGTFHAKYMVVDRKVAILQSNNIQDNDNLEMMIHLEGPIVDSLYDMALISWHKKMEPPLPSHDHPASEGGVGTWLDEGATTGLKAGNGHVCEPGAADVLAGPSTTQSILHPSNVGLSGNGAPVLPRIRGTEPNGAQDDQAEGYLKKGDQALPQARVDHPASPGNYLPQHTIDDPHYDADIAGEVARVQAAVSPKAGETRAQAVTQLLNHSVNKGFDGDAALECPPGEEMTPYIAHPAQEPIPMALVNRNPYGPPTHRSLTTPQNAAWLSALRNAEKNVFIQTPTLNAGPLIPAIREVCERGVDVYCYVCLGYNDAVC